MHLTDQFASPLRVPLPGADADATLKLITDLDRSTELDPERLAHDSAQQSVIVQVARAAGV